MLLLPLAWILLCLSSTNAANTPNSPSQMTPQSASVSPISFTPDQNWDGIAGQWSSFTLQVGNPPQFVRTFVSFSAYQTWVVVPQGCDAASGYSTCAFNRGGVFQQNQSTTFSQKGLFDLDPVRYLGYGGNAIFGFDTVGLGGVGEGGPVINNTIVGGFAAEYYYLGVFGVNPKPTNFTGFNQESTSYMTLLRQQNLIPSVSAAYTAGAQYAFGGAGQLASLTLGGYDTARFVPNNVQFVFGLDNSKDLLVAIQSITTPQNGTTPLLPVPIFANIDSTVPEIWLPPEACMAFEKAFGLIWDNKTALYLLNDTQHQALQKRNASVTFTLAQTTQGGPTVDIRLPYAAFDLLAKSPYQRLQNDTHYFPLKRAANDTQYVLGRTFLQEAYLSVNWDAQRFNVSQVNWQQNTPKQIVAMPGFTNNNSTASNVVTSGAIGGILVGALVVVALVSGGLYYHVLRRRRRLARTSGIKKLEDDAASTAMSNISRSEDSPGLPTSTVFPKAELEGSYQYGQTYYNPKQHAQTASRSHTNATRSTAGPFDDAPNLEGTTTVSRNDSSSTGPPHSPTSPFGEGTYSTFTGTHLTTATTTSSSHTHPDIHEMAGDLPPIVEKDSRSLSEKEVLYRREQLYNGVTPPQTAVSETFPHRRPSSTRQVVHPDDVALVSPTGRTFSVGGMGNGGTYVVSPTTPVAPPYVAGGFLPPLPTLPEGVKRPGARRKFSFEDLQAGEDEGSFGERKRRGDGKEEDGTELHE